MRDAAASRMFFVPGSPPPLSGEASVIISGALIMDRFLNVRNLSHPIENPARIRRCESFVCRLRGLMFRSHLDTGDGILLEISRDSRVDTSIHMFFVPFDLAVIWINSDLCVVDKVIARGWHPAYFPARAARYTLEIHPDRFDNFSIGDKVEFHDV